MSIVDEFQVSDIRSACGECGMICAASEYHPYAACLMYRGCQDAEIVRANLGGVRAFGAQCDSGFDGIADELAALLAYAESCKAEYPLLSQDLRAKPAITAVEQNNG